MAIATGHETPLISTAVQASVPPAAFSTSQSVSAVPSAKTAETAVAPAWARHAATALSRALTTAGGSRSRLRTWFARSVRPGPGSGSSAGNAAADQLQTAASGARTLSVNPSS